MAAKLRVQALEQRGVIEQYTAIVNPQKLSGAVVFPEDYFNPRSSVTGELRKTENTHSIHWYSASWMPWHKRLRSAISKPVHFILGRAKGRGR